MVRTKADGAPKAVAAKAPRKVLGNSGGGGAGSSFRLSGGDTSGNKYAGGNPVCPRPTPDWQKDITAFFKRNPSRDKENEAPEDEAAGGSGGTSHEVTADIEPVPSSKGKGKGKGKGKKSKDKESSDDAVAGGSSSSDAAAAGSSSSSSGVTEEPAGGSGSSSAGGSGSSSSKKRKSCDDEEESPQSSPVKKRNGIIESDDDE